MRSQAFTSGVLALALGLVVVGCGGEPEPDPVEQPEEPAAADDLDTSFVMLAEIEAVGTGAAAFTWAGREQIHVTRVGSPEIDTNLLSVGFLVPVKTDDPQNRFRWAVDLLSGYADEPATFTISSDPVNAQGLRDVTFLIWMRVHDGSKDAVYEMDEVEFLEEFRELRQDCTFEVGEGVLSGSLSCPELATADGETAGFTVTWRNGERLPDEE